MSNVKVQADFNNDGIIDQIWAAQSDTLTSDNLGDGLINNTDANGKITLNIEMATDVTLGGIKVGSGLTMTPDGVLSANVKQADDYLLPAATTQTLGGILVGDGISVDETGLATIPVAEEVISARNGATDLSARFTNVETSVTSNANNITTVQSQVATNGKAIVSNTNNIATNASAITANTNAIAANTSDISANANIITTLMQQITSLKDFINNNPILNVATTAFAGFITGTGMFDGNNGTVVNIGSTVNDTNYKVAILPTGDSSGYLGEFFVTAKTTTTFKVVNTGTANTIPFNWILMRSDAPAFNMASFPYQSVSGTFASTNGATINMPNDDGSIAYLVLITPTSDTGANLGEFWIDSKATNSFVVKNSGSNNTATFDAIIIKSGLPAYNAATNPMTEGSGVFNSAAGTVITLEAGIDVSTYKVGITPNVNPNGYLGEYWVTNKQLGQFTVMNSGTAVTGFDYVLMK